MKKSLEDFPRDIAIDTWNDMSAWLKDNVKSNVSDKSSLVPLVEARFGSLLEHSKTCAADRLRVSDLTADTHQLSLQLADQFKRLDNLHTKRNAATAPADITALDAEIAALRTEAQHLETIVEERDLDAQAAEAADGIADNADFVPLNDPIAPVETRSWPEDNYEDFASKHAALSTSLSITTKVPLASLLFQQKAPAGSKTLMPRALELFSSAEIDAITPRSIKSRWCNYYEDPVEPAKCWTQDEFSVLYDKPGFHFMIARVAQAGVQFLDSKLGVLQESLTNRWKMTVELQRMKPCMDWMLATIPSLSDLSSKILHTSLIRLQDGNAVYVVRHFAAPTRVRDLEVTIASTNENPGSLFNKLKNRCLEFEKSGIHLGWRVAGVRPSNAPTKIRATFYLDSFDEYWPWFQDWSHPHGSIPESIPLLNFDPAWKARKPYACQICYNSDHHTTECPLPHVRIGGVPLISAVSRGLIMNRKPAERRTWRDDSLKPVPGGSRKAPDPDSNAAPVPPAPACLSNDMINDGDDVMADGDNLAGLATDKAHFTDPLAQLCALFPYILDPVLATALTQGGSVDSAVRILQVSHQFPPLPAVHASGSGQPILPLPASRPHPFDNLADFIFEKLARVFSHSGAMPRPEMLDLLMKRNGDLPLIIQDLQSAGLRFSWSYDDMNADWDDWVNGRYTPHAATPLSSFSNVTMLHARSPAPAPSYYKESQFVLHVLRSANIVVPIDVDVDALSDTYRGQFPAILRKLATSYSVPIPSSWTKSFMVSSFSKWLIPSPPFAAPALSTAVPPAVAPPSAATGQTPAPVILPCTPQISRDRMSCPILPQFPTDFPL